nr:nitrilase-related carbon-nitrogen hydrolase [Corynebacterium lactis]
MRIALAQLELLDTVAGNLAAVKETIARASQQGVDLVVFPEATMKAFNTGRLDTVASESSEHFADEVSTAAQQAGISVVVGMFRPADEVERDGKTRRRVFNSLLLAWPEAGGPGVEYYDKIHLFDAFGFRESDTVAPGSSQVVCDIPLADGTTAAIGLATCFDVRFPEQFVDLAGLGADVIVLPASWNDGHGKVSQWQTLVAARALDSTCFLAATGAARPGGAARAGKAEGPTGVGHSMLVGPDGAVIASAGYGPQLIVADVDLGDLARVRKEIPVLEIRHG